MKVVSAVNMKRVQGLTLLAWFALQVVFVFKTVILPMGGRDPNLTVWAFHSLPLLLFLPGLWRGDPRTFAWLAFAVLMYFTLAVEALFSPQASLYHWFTLVLVIALFVGSTLFIRWNGLLSQASRSTGEEHS